jgi:hypothetical protein
MYIRTSIRYHYEDPHDIRKLHDKASEMFPIGFNGFACYYDSNACEKIIIMMADELPEDEQEKLCMVTVQSWETMYNNLKGIK